MGKEVEFAKSSFFVVLILSIILVILSVILIMKLFCYTVYTQDKIISLIENEIVESSSNVFASQVYMKQDVGRFGIKIQNLNTPGYFYVNIQCSKIVNSDGSETSCESNPPEITYFSRYFIESGEYKIANVIASLNKSKDKTFILDVCICEADDEDGSCLDWAGSIKCSGETINLYAPIQKVYVTSSKTGNKVFDTVC